MDKAWSGRDVGDRAPSRLEMVVRRDRSINGEPIGPWNIAGAMLMIRVMRRPLLLRLAHRTPVIKAVSVVLHLAILIPLGLLLSREAASPPPAYAVEDMWRAPYVAVAVVVLVFLAALAPMVALGFAPPLIALDALGVFWATHADLGSDHGWQLLFAVAFIVALGVSLMLQAAVLVQWYVRTRNLGVGSWSCRRPPLSGGAMTRAA